MRNKNSESDRVTLTLITGDDLRAFVPEGGSTYPRLFRRIQSGKCVTISLSKRSIVEKGALRVKMADNARSEENNGSKVADH